MFTCINNSLDLFFDNMSAKITLFLHQLFACKFKQSICTFSNRIKLTHQRDLWRWCWAGCQWELQSHLCWRCMLWPEGRLWPGPEIVSLFWLCYLLDCEDSNKFWFIQFFHNKNWHHSFQFIFLSYYFFLSNYLQVQLIHSTFFNAICLISIN